MIQHMQNVFQRCSQLLATSSLLPEEKKRYTPIQTSPNWPFPRRLMSCRDSRGISHTSLVLTDRSVKRGMPLWHGTIRRQHSPAALAGIITHETKWVVWDLKSRSRRILQWRGTHQSSAERAAAGFQTGPWWWCSSLRCPVYGSYSVWRGRP